MRKKHQYRNVSVLLTEETYDLLVEETDKRELTISGFLRKMIENKLDKIKIEGEQSNE